MSTKTIITPSFVTFCIEMQDAFDEGYRLDVDNYPCTWGRGYEGILVRDDVKEEMKAVFVDSPDTIDFSNVVSVLPSSEEAGKRGRKPKAV